MPLLPVLALMAIHQGSQKLDILQSNLDTTVSPTQDFFQYANGGWIKTHPIPGNETSYGISVLIRDELYTRLQKVNQDAAAASDATPGSDQQKIGDFWNTAMDTDKANSLGLKPLESAMEQIDSVSSVQSALRVAFALQYEGVGVLCNYGASQDEKDSDVMAMHLFQGGLGLPNRDYYFSTEPTTAAVRVAYVQYLKDALTLMGESDAGAKADNVMAFETALANVSRKLEDERDPEKNYNKMPIEDVQKNLDPSIDWKAELAVFGAHPKTVIVGQPEFFAGLDKALNSTPIDTIKAYYKLRLFDSYAAFLDSKSDDLHFDFFGKTLTGRKEQQPRWKRALQAEGITVGMIVGRAFVKDYFPPASKKKYSDLIENVRSAYSARIDKLDWMSPETKAKAHYKLSKLNKKVGYPDHWKDYSKLVVGRNSFCENMMNIAKWSAQDDINKLDKPVDRGEWGMTPQTFNAYYDPSNNEIVMPAAAFALPGLQDSEIDEALMYGNASASWIGHEMTHGFDDEGRQFDAKGNLANWWTTQDAENFDKRTQLMIQQFDAYEPLPGLHVNGKACLGENIADYGGVLLGIDAFKKTKAYKENKIIGGLTPMQRFFLGYALSWMDEQRPEALRNQILTDVHAPAFLRCNGPLSNIPAFYEAFGVKEGDPMWRPVEKRPQIW